MLNKPLLNDEAGGDVRSKIVADVKTLQKLTRQLDTESLKIGTAKDTVAWRATFKAKLQTGVETVLALKTAESRIRASTIDPTQDKLLQQSKSPIDNFEKLHETITSKLADHVPVDNQRITDDLEAGHGQSDASGYLPPDQQQQQQQQQQGMEQMGLVSMEADINHLEEQNRAVKKIADDVQELNEAFTDLNTLVTDQGQNIDQIEDNTGKAKEQVKDGTVQLEKAEKHHISYRKKQCYLLLCVLILFGIVFGVIFGVPGITKKK
mmetsp:Transcript_7444/g.11593  ORF Transcript_7444/g.11593 Transcript_7444/m.11593 type:complete len:265 (+) Transcript_7444:128-922(+)|eukprot:CAMPEP_0202693044 /NCGR_PEP_ID=MMETSP1385-20130828/7268_1 /ASSEMBLY_ACC=CAM_ASM_000861 /TAXON_ID=933848 /ORGANISM="Elphidium margaritaceum" /LENGTH=264 /DNA_ID=CAMNT_0049348675 /DNA_START=117 /DNA_END=911 /DNA_ORIENTATION=-